MEGEPEGGRAPGTLPSLLISCVLIDKREIEVNTSPEKDVPLKDSRIPPVACVS